MQSLLPDVNTAFITHRRSAIEALRSFDVDKIFGSLTSWNALLPEDKTEEGVYKYRILISDIEYQRLTTVQNIAICNHCKKEIEYKDVRPVVILVPLIESILTKETRSEIWECPKCNKDNKLKETDIIEDSLTEPYFLGVVPKYPRRKDGLMDRHEYERKVTQWAWNFISELEEKSTKVRKDYAENKLDTMPYDEIDGGEE